MTTWIRNSANAILRPGGVGPAGRLTLNVADASPLWDGGKWRVWFATAFDQNDASPPTEVRVAMNYADGPTPEALTVRKWGSLLPTCMTGGNASDWDYTNVEAACVVKNPDSKAPPSRRWMMFYSGGNTKAGAVPTGQPYYSIGLAYSSDGRAFTRVSAGESPHGKAGLVLRGVDILPGRSPTSAVVSDPTVVTIGGVFMLWCSMIAFDGPQMLTAGVSLATSLDGRNWFPEASNPLQSLWRDGIAVGWQPTVINNGSELEMMFTADTDAEREALPCPGDAAVGFYKATSHDGKKWTPDFSARDFVCDNSPTENCNLITGVGLAMKGAERHIFYSAYSTNNVPPSLALPVVWQMNEAKAG